jgi:hypothetical protein
VFAYPEFAKALLMEGSLFESPVMKN